MLNLTLTYPYSLVAVRRIDKMLHFNDKLQY